MSKSKFRFSKVIRIWLQVFEYSIFIYLFTCLIGVNSFSVVSFVKCFFPVTTEEYWFVTKYLLLLVLSPILNMFIDRCEKKQLGLTCIILITIFSLLPTIFCYRDYTNTVEGYSLLWFITLYMTAAYVRIYGLALIESPKKCILGYGINVLLLFLSKIIMYLLSSLYFGRVTYTNLFFRYNAVFAFMSSLFLFGYFRQVKINNAALNKFVSFFSPMTFGVYLIHLAPALKDWLWKGLLNPSRLDNEITHLLYYIVIVLFVYIICSFIEMLRQRTLEKPKVIQVWFQKTDDEFNSISESLMNKLDA